MSSPSGFVLFVPLYGNGGTGELVRATYLARALARRAPRTRIEFVLPGGKGTRQDVPFAAHCHQGPEESKGAFDRELIKALKPDVVVFDSGCRTSTLALCRHLNILTAYVSDRAGTRDKAFRFDWLSKLDVHWHQREHVTGAAFAWSQRQLARFSACKRVVFDTYLSDDPIDEAELPPEYSERLNSPFVLWSPGGGGYRVDGEAVGDLFFSVAEQLHEHTGAECLTLMGALYPDELPTGRTMALRQVSQPVFARLLRSATAVVTNGGHTLNQALACKAACVVAPLGGDDQPPRIAVYAEAGLVVPADPTPQSLLQMSSQLMADAAQRRRLAHALHARPVVNGLPLMVDGLVEMLNQAARRGGAA